MRYWFYHFTKFVLWVIFRFGFGLEVRGREHVPKTGAVILASNHVSFLDPPVVGTACPRRVAFMARADLFRHPALGLFLRGVHVIPLRRGEADTGAVREALARLRGGEVVGIFPEGTRQVSGQLSAAKRGVGLLACAAQAPIVPVVVKGTHEALPPHARRLHRAKIRVAFGRAISYSSSSLPSEQAAATRREFSGSPQRAGRSHYEALAAQLTAEWRRLAEQLS